MLRIGMVVAVLLAASLACSPGGDAKEETPSAIQATESLITTGNETPAIDVQAPLTLTPLPTAPAAQRLPDPGRYDWRRVAGPFERPVGVENAGDPRLFVIEQPGTVRVIDESGEIRAESFLDIRDRVNDGANEQGLLGLAFHPNYTQNGYLFVNYTDSGGGTVISRFETSNLEPDLAIPSSEKILLEIPQPFENHNGGALAFGPDGFLYIATGDGGSQGDPRDNGQNPQTLLGKILRIDVDSGEPYNIPSDNPFGEGEGAPEVWALGLRNPWRIAFDSSTGDLYIGDVGQNNWEEINFQPADSPGGVNYGWPDREGAHSFRSTRKEGLTDPVAEYGTGQFGCSVTGGQIIRNPNLAEWEGVYLYGDYCSGRIWGLLQGADGTWQSEILFLSDRNLSSFGQGYDGEVYFVGHGGWIFRLDDAE